MTRPPICAWFRFATRIVFFLALVSLAAGAYQQRLDSEAIREAYSLGRRNDQTTGVFLSRYVQVFSGVGKWPYVSRVELLTPYSQIVFAAKDDLANASMYDAVRKYASRDIPVLLRIQANWSPLSALPTDDKDVWGRFTISVAQGHPLNFSKRSWTPYYGSRGDTLGFDYIEMEWQFDVKDVASAPIAIDVTSPDGQRVEAKFDLSKLK